MIMNLGFDGITTRPYDMNILYELLRETSIHFIITSRTWNAFSSLPSVSVPVLEPDEQLELFSIHFGRTPCKKDIPKVRTIMGYYDGCTIYIKNAAKYMVRHEKTCDEMLAGITLWNEHIIS